MTFPASAVDDSMQVCIGVVENLPALPDSIVGIGIPYYFWPDGLQTTEPITIGIPYSHLDLSSMNITNPTDVPVFYFSTCRDEWSRLPIFDTDPNNEYLFVKVTELCYMTYAIHPDSLTGIKQQLSVNAPISSFTLKSNYPNPFNPQTIIEYQVHKMSQITLEIYNTLGQRIITLVDIIQHPGSYQAIWDARDKNGNLVGTGLYFYIMKDNQHIEIRKTIFMK